METGAYSEETVDGISEVADAGEILLTQQVTSSAVVQVPPLHLSALSDGLGVSMAPDQDEGHNSVTTGAHSEETVDGISEVADAGEILLTQQVTSSAAVQVPPLHLEALQPVSPRCQHRILRPGRKNRICVLSFDWVSLRSDRK